MGVHFLKPWVTAFPFGFLAFPSCNFPPFVQPKHAQTRYTALDALAFFNSKYSNNKIYKLTNIITIKDIIMVKTATRITTIF